MCPKYYWTQLSCAKKVVEKFGFGELKIEKLKLLLRFQPKFAALTFLTLEVG